MPTCKHCEVSFDWSKMNDRWVPLMPIGTEGDHPRTHVDDNGQLRTLHNVVCEEPTRTVHITPLAQAVRVCDLPIKKRRLKK
jgi:hypothetical protein